MLGNNRLLAPERPRMSMPSTEWGKGRIGKAGNLGVLGTMLVRLNYHIHEIGEAVVVLQGYLGWCHRFVLCGAAEHCYGGNCHQH